MPMWYLRSIDENIQLYSMDVNFEMLVHYDPPERRDHPGA